MTDLQTTHQRLPTGELRQVKEQPDLAERLAGFGIHDTTRFIPGFRITYRELDNIAAFMRSQGWSGFIGLDEAVEALGRG